MSVLVRWALVVVVLAVAAAVALWPRHHSGGSATPPSAAPDLTAERARAARYRIHGWSRVDAADLNGVKGQLARGRPVLFAIAVGPEGGFTDEEIEIGRRAGWQVINLGPRILRVETAALVLAAAAALSALPDAHV